MTRPTWATVFAVIMILIGGCGAINDMSDINAEKIVEMQSKMTEKIEQDQKVQNQDSTSLNAKRDSADTKIIELFGDTVVKDANNQTDITKTIMGIMKMSPYRIQWMKRFGYMGLGIAALFILAAVFMFRKHKLTIPVVITTLSLSIAFGILQLFIYKADQGSSQMITKSANFGFYFSIFVDVVMLIVFMVLDKTFYTNANSTEDYYD